MCKVKYKNIQKERKQSLNSFTDYMSQFRSQFDFSKKKLPITNYKSKFEMMLFDRSNNCVPVLDNCYFYVIK